MDNEATLTHLYEQRRELIRRLNVVEKHISMRLGNDGYMRTGTHRDPRVIPLQIADRPPNEPKPNMYPLWDHQRDAIHSIQNDAGDAA